MSRLHLRNAYCHWIKNILGSSSLLLLLLSALRIRPCGLYQIRITSKIMNLYHTWQGFLGVRSVRREVPAFKGQHNTKKTRTNIHTLNGIRTHVPSIQAATTHSLDSAATVIGPRYYLLLKYNFIFWFMRIQSLVFYANKTRAQVTGCLRTKF